MSSPVRILLVEDEAMNRVLLRAVLDRADDSRLRAAALTEAATLASAREHLAQGSVDIVILDVRLPDGSGLELAAELAARPPEDRPRIVVLSASVLPSERQAAIEAGCDAFMAKPYRPTELVAVLGGFLGGGTERPPA